MAVTQVLLKVSPANDITQAVSVDVTQDIAAAGKTIYNVGAASTTRWYFATLTDDAGNTSTFPLGSYTTAAAAMTIEASRALDTTDPLYVSGSGTVSGTDVALAYANNFILKLSSTPSLPFTVGVRLKFDNTTTFSVLPAGYIHSFLIRMFGSVSGGGVTVNFNLYELSGTYSIGVRWNGRDSSSQLIGDPNTIMKTGYFWVFLTGTFGGSLTFRSFDTDDATLTASSTNSVSIPAPTGDLRVRCYNQFRGASNTVTVDKLWYKPSADYEVTPASTL